MKRSDRRPTGFRLRMSGWSIWRRHTQAADTIRWHLVVKDRIAQNAARAYLKPTDDRAVTYHTGQSFSEMPGDRHSVSENASKTEPAKLLAVFVVDTDEKELTTPYKK